MFRDSKEYQEIAKIYDEKVSKSGELNERVKGGGVSTAPKININIPKAGSGGSGNVRGAGAKPGISLNKSTGMGGSGGRNNPGGSTPIRKIDPAPFNRSASSVTSTPSGDNLKAGSFGISQAGKDQAAKNRAEFNKPKPSTSDTSSVSTTTRQGKPRTKAQILAAKRIASGKTIQQVKDENTKSMRAKAKERFEKFKADREAKRLERMKEEYTPYDMVLEYLLSTEQAATIEEANYVMMQLDEENIQEIVGTALKGLKMVGKFGAKGVPQFAATLGTTAALAPSVGKGLYKATETVGNIVNKIRGFDPVGDARNKYQDKKAKEYEEKSGTTKKDGYFR